MVQTLKVSFLGSFLAHLNIIFYFTLNAQKWSSFRKKLLNFFPTSRGGPDPKVEFFNPCPSLKVSFLGFFLAHLNIKGWGVNVVAAIEMGIAAMF